MVPDLAMISGMSLRVPIYRDVAIPNIIKAILKAMGHCCFGGDCFTLPLASSQDRSQ